MGTASSTPLKIISTAGQQGHRDAKFRRYGARDGIRGGAGARQPCVPDDRQRPQEQTERILANGVSILKQNIAQKRAEGTARGDYNVDLKDEITGAAAVVVNVKTGEPLAMSSWPTTMSRRYWRTIRSCSKRRMPRSLTAR